MVPLRRIGLIAGILTVAAIAGRWLADMLTSGVCAGWGDGRIGVNNAAETGLPRLIAFPPWAVAHPFETILSPWKTGFDLAVLAALAAFLLAGAATLARRLRAARHRAIRPPGLVGADLLALLFILGLLGARYTSCELRTIHRNLDAIARAWADPFAPDGGTPAASTVVARMVRRRLVGTRDGVALVALTGSDAGSCVAYLIRPAPARASMRWRRLAALPAPLPRLLMADGWRRDRPGQAVYASVRGFGAGRAASMLVCDAASWDSA